MLIKVLGSGCKNCMALTDNVKSAVEEMGVEAQIEKVTDLVDIAKYSVMQIPALVVNEKVLSCGKVLKPVEVKILLEKVL